MTWVYYVHTQEIYIFPTLHNNNIIFDKETVSSLAISVFKYACMLHYISAADSWFGTNKVFVRLIFFSSSIYATRLVFCSCWLRFIWCSQIPLGGFWVDIYVVCKLEREGKNCKKKRKGIHDVAIILFPCPGFFCIFMHCFIVWFLDV